MRKILLPNEKMLGPEFCQGIIGSGISIVLLGLYSIVIGLPITPILLILFGFSFLILGFGILPTIRKMLNS